MAEICFVYIVCIIKIVLLRPEDKFLKEFIGRLDEIIVFQPLNNEIMKGFVAQKIKKIEDAIDKKIEVSEEVIDRIMESGFHDQYGARKLNYTVDMLVGTALAELKMNSDWDELTTIKVELNSGDQACAEAIEFKPVMSAPEQPQRE